jgi:hypothetical protein
MDWTQQFDNYCERVDFTFWAEPLNAITNAAFLVGALLALRFAARRGALDWGIVGLVLILTAIGIGSFLFHTFATVWAVTTDVVPILLYILLYIYLATTRFFQTQWWVGLIAILLFFPYSFAVTSALTPLVGDLNGSMGYVPVPLLIAAYGAALYRRDPQTAIGLWIGVALLVASLTFRTVDEAVCAALPVGTHLMWHLLNGVMLGWMITVMVRGQARAAAHSA